MKFTAFPFLVLACVTIFHACGGGGSGDSDDSAPTTGEDLQDITPLEGQWVLGLCVAKSDGQTSTKTVYIMTETSDTEISYRSGSLTYASTDCSGTGSQSELTSDLGSVTFSGTLLLGESRYFRGSWKLSNGTTTPVIWALASAKKLCLMTDQEPTLFPTAQNVKDYVDVLKPEICYYKS